MNEKIFIVICILIICIILYLAICIKDYLYKINRLQNKKKQDNNSTKDTKINNEFNNIFKNENLTYNSLLLDNDNENYKNDVNIILPKTTNNDPIQLNNEIKIDNRTENDGLKKAKKVSSKKTIKSNKYIKVRFIDSDEIYTFLAPYKCELRKGDYCLIEYNDLEQQVIAVSDIYYESLVKNRKFDYLKIIKYLDEQEIKTNNRIINPKSNLNFPYGAIYKVKNKKSRIMPRAIVFNFLELVYKIYHESPLLVNEVSDDEKFVSAINLAVGIYDYTVTMKDIFYHFGPYCIMGIYNLELLVNHSIYVRINQDNKKLLEYDICINKNNGKKGMIIFKNYNRILRNYIFTFKETDSSYEWYDLLEDNLEFVSH